MEATPRGGILLTPIDESYFLARFTQEIYSLRPDVAVVNIRFLPMKRYRSYLTDEHGIVFPVEMPTIDISKDLERLNLEAEEACRIWVNNCRRPLYLTMNTPPTYLPNDEYIMIGPGKAYCVDMNEEEIKAENLRLYAEVLVFDAVSDTTYPFPKATERMIFWYDQPPLTLVRKWYAESDIESADSMISLLLNSLPAHWRPAMYYLSMHPEADGEKREELLRSITRFINLHPDRHRPRNALRSILGDETEAR